MVFQSPTKPIELAKNKQSLEDLRGVASVVGFSEGKKEDVGLILHPSSPLNIETERERERERERDGC
jgi:hypothetical protein